MDSDRRRGDRSPRRAGHQGCAVGGTPDVGAGRGGEGRQVLPVFPGQGQTGRVPHRRGRRRQPGGPVQGAARSRSRAATPSIRPCSRTTTASTTCTSAASGAGSCRSGSRATTRPMTMRSPPDDQPALLPSSRAWRRHDGVRREAAGREDRRRERQAAAVGDHDRRFFEASWVHKYKGNYYFSYSTGDTHFIATRWASRRTVRSRTRAGSSSPCWAGPTTTRSSRSMASGTCSTTTARFERRHAPAQHQAADRDPVQRGRHDPDHRSVPGEIRRRRPPADRGAGAARPSKRVRPRVSCGARLREAGLFLAMAVARRKGLSSAPMTEPLEPPPETPSLMRRRRPFLAPLWLLALGGRIRSSRGIHLLEFGHHHHDRRSSAMPRRRSAPSPTRRCHPGRAARRAARADVR